MSFNSTNLNTCALCIICILEVSPVKGVLLKVYDFEYIFELPVFFRLQYKLKSVTFQSKVHAEIM